MRTTPLTYHPGSTLKHGVHGLDLGRDSKTYNIHQGASGGVKKEVVKFRSFSSGPFSKKTLQNYRNYNLCRGEGSYLSSVGCHGLDDLLLAILLWVVLEV